MLAAVFAVIIYRVIIVAVLYAQGDTLIKKYAKLLTTATAALLSLITIMLLNKIYEKIAIFLTNFGKRNIELIMTIMTTFILPLSVTRV